jgi:nitrogen regulatory protein P-II 1
MKLVVAIVRPEALSAVLEALFRAEVRGLTINRVQGHGGEVERVETYRGTTVKMELSEKVRLEIGVSDHFVEPTVKAILAAARTGDVGDGKIFVLPVEKVYRIRTGEEDQAAVTPIDETPSRGVQQPARGSAEKGTFQRGMGPREGSRIIRSTIPRGWLRVTMAAKVSISGQRGKGTSSGASSPSFTWYRTISPRLVSMRASSAVSVSRAAVAMAPSLAFAAATSGARRASGILTAAADRWGPLRDRRHAWRAVGAAFSEAMGWAGAWPPRTGTRPWLPSAGRRARAACSG